MRPLHKLVTWACTWARYMSSLHEPVIWVHYISPLHKPVHRSFSKIRYISPLQESVKWAHTWAHYISLYDELVHEPGKWARYMSLYMSLYISSLHKLINEPIYKSIKCVRTWICMYSVLRFKSKYLNTQIHWNSNNSNNLISGQ